MKTKEQKTKTIPEELREIRDRLNLEMQDMTCEQIKACLGRKKTLHAASVWNKPLTATDAII
ncbi:MAG: hypothetical protein LBK22_00925 [Tannerella sp.]|jgi:hypothetical protein|nr:hypothetical protein [Tannerella sp.]